MSCWLWFSCMKHWEAAGKSDATCEKHVLAPMSVNFCDFPDPRFWLTSGLPSCLELRLSEGIQGPATSETFLSDFAPLSSLCWIDTNKIRKLLRRLFDLSRAGLLSLAAG